MFCFVKISKICTAEYSIKICWCNMFIHHEKRIQPTLLILVCSICCMYFVCMVTIIKWCCILYSNLIFCSLVLMFLTFDIQTHIRIYKHENTKQSNIKNAFSLCVFCCAGYELVTHIFCLKSYILNGQTKAFIVYGMKVGLLYAFVNIHFSNRQ